MNPFSFFWLGSSNDCKRVASVTMYPAEVTGISSWQVYVPGPITIYIAGKQKLRQERGKKKGLFQMTVRALELCGTGKHPNTNIDIDSIGSTFW